MFVQVFCHHKPPTTMMKRAHFTVVYNHKVDTIIILYTLTLQSILQDKSKCADLGKNLIAETPLV
jgi:hypothetical protein